MGAFTNHIKAFKLHLFKRSKERFRTKLKYKYNSAVGAIDELIVV